MRFLNLCVSVLIYFILWDLLKVYYHENHIFSQILHPGPLRIRSSSITRVSKSFWQLSLVFRTNSSMNTITASTRQRYRAPSAHDDGGGKLRSSSKHKISQHRVFPLVAVRRQTLSLELKGIVNKAGWGVSHSPMCLASGGGDEDFFFLSYARWWSEKKQPKEREKEKCCF